MGVTLSLQDGVLLAELQGDIDHHTAKEMRETIDARAEQDKPKAMHLDFSKVEFMDSSGIGLIMGRYKLMQTLGGTLKVVHVPPYILRVIRLSGLAQLGILEKDVKR